MTTKFFLKRQNSVSGPYTQEQAKSAASSGKLKPSDLVGPSQEGPWEQVAASFELSPYLRSESSFPQDAKTLNSNSTGYTKPPFNATSLTANRGKAKTAGDASSTLLLLWSLIGVLSIGLLVVSGLLIFRSPNTEQTQTAIVSPGGDPPDSLARKEVALLKEKLAEAENKLNGNAEKIAQLSTTSETNLLRVSQLESELAQAKENLDNANAKLRDAQEYAKKGRDAEIRDAQERARASRQTEIAQQRRNQNTQAAPDSRPRQQMSSSGDPYSRAEEYLTNLQMAAQARGDVEAALEYERVKAAIPLLKTGDDDLLNRLSQSTVASAKLAVRRFQQENQPNGNNGPPNGGGQDPYKQAQEYLDSLVLSARANGDTESMMEYDQAKAALSALASGNQEMLGMFSPSVIAKAKLALGRFQR